MCSSVFVKQSLVCAWLWMSFLTWREEEGLRQPAYSCSPDVCHGKTSRGIGAISPVEATEEHTTGGGELFSARRRESVKEKHGLCFQHHRKLTTRNYCKHLLSFVSLSPVICVTPCQVLGPGINRRSTLLPRLLRPGGQCQGKSLHTVCVCVCACVWWAATVVEKWKQQSVRAGDESRVAAGP